MRTASSAWILILALALARSVNGMQIFIHGDASNNTLSLDVAPSETIEASGDELLRPAACQRTLNNYCCF